MEIVQFTFRKMLNELFLLSNVVCRFSLRFSLRGLGVELGGLDNDPSPS